MANDPKISKLRIALWAGVLVSVALVSLLIVWLVAGFFLPLKFQYDDARQYRTYNDDPHAQGWCTQIPFVAPYCALIQMLPNKETRRNDEDLRAQQEMADWTFFVLLISLFGLVVSTLGLGFLFWSLKQTQNAVGAAVYSNEIAKENAEADRRPWVSVKEIAVRSILVAQDVHTNKDCLIVHTDVTIQNTGRTPAVHADIRFVSDNVFGPSGFLSKMDVAFNVSKDRGASPVGRAIAPDSVYVEESMASSDVGITMSDGVFIDDQTALYFGVVITYMGPNSTRIFETTSRYTVQTKSEIGLVTLRASDANKGKTFGLKPLGLDTMT